MAWDQTAKVSLTAGSTFSTGDLYKGVSVGTDGNAILVGSATGAGSTGGNRLVGTLYSATATTSTDDNAVLVGVGPVVKVFMAGSTLKAGDSITFSTGDSHGVAATTNDAFGIIIDGSSGSTGRIVSVLRF